MESIEQKLNSNNPRVVAQVISTIIKNITRKPPSDVPNSPELKFLYDKSTNNDPLISESVCDAILLLVKKGVLDAESVLHDFVTKIASVQCYSGITHLLGQLLYIELDENLKKGTKICQYNLRFPQHPFVTLVHEHSDSWNFLLEEIRVFYNNEDENIVSHRDKLFRPLFLYVLCNPGETGLNLFKERLWRCIINSQCNEETLLDILGWLHMESRNNIELISEFLNEYLQIVKSDAAFKVIVLYQVSTLYHLLLYRNNPTTTIRVLNTIIIKKQIADISNYLLYIFTKMIKICSCVYLESLLLLCQKLISNIPCDLIALSAFKASLIHLIANACLLDDRSVQIARSIYQEIEKSSDKSDCLERCILSKRIFNSNNEIYLAVTLTNLSCSLNNNENLDLFLKNLESCPQFYVKSIIHFIYGIFLQNNTLYVERSLLDIILKNTRVYLEIAPETLSVILYKLSRTTNQQMHLSLLKALPKISILKENYHKIVGTILALNNGPTRLQNVSALLMFEIWKLEDRTYSNLETMLMMECKSKRGILEFYTTKAYILKEICAFRPGKYGKEIVAHFSNILNNHSGEGGALPCSLAIEGIRYLCKAGIIDAVTTWASIFPKFKDDFRTPIVVSLCNLIHEIPQLNYTEAYPQLINDVVARLWFYVLHSENCEMMEAALNGLTSFSLEQISSHFPDEYLDADTLESKQNNAASQIVPGKTWIYLLKSSKDNIKCFGNFLIKMTSIEVSNYLKYVYQVKGNTEPIHFTTLPPHSIVRAVGEYLKQWLSKWKDFPTRLIYMECLRIFSQEYSKPLPPYNWHFLLEVIDDPIARPYCIDIACHQVIMSGSARQIIDNLVEACTSTKNEGDMICIYKNLKFLANSLQPMILKPFFTTSLKMAIDSFENRKDRAFLDQIVVRLTEVLKNPSILDINKTTISEVLCDQLYSANSSSPIFNVLVDMTPVLPEKIINKITHSSQCASITQDWFEKSLVLRCKMAETTDKSPLDYLEDVLDVACFTNINNKFNSLILPCFTKVFKNQVEKEHCALWLLELLGKIQAKIASRTEPAILIFLFDILISAVIIFSGHFTFENSTDSTSNMLDFFPQAFSSLLLVDQWSICTNQALEWLYHVNTEDYIPVEYRRAFGITLQSFRHHSEFTKNLKWMKYYNCKVEIEE